MEISKSLKWGARAGYAARGVVYLIIGGFAVIAAFGSGRTEDTKGALTTLLSQPFGEVLMTIMALGLLAFALWRFGQAIADLDGHGTDAKAVAVRLGLFGSGVAHLALAIFAASLLVSLGRSSGGDPTAGWLQWLFGTVWGRWVAMAIATIPIWIGLAHIVRGWRASYVAHLELDGKLLRTVKPICSFGLIARGIVFIVIGVLALYGGGIYDAEDAPGLQSALNAIQGLPFGRVLFALVAVGLLAFAAYCFVEAAYHRIRLRETAADR